MPVGVIRPCTHLSDATTGAGAPQDACDLSELDRAVLHGGWCGWVSAYDTQPRVLDLAYSAAHRMLLPPPSPIPHHTLPLPLSPLPSGACTSSAGLAAGFVHERVPARCPPQPVGSPTARLAPPLYTAW